MRTIDPRVTGVLRLSALIGFGLGLEGCGSETQAAQSFDANELHDAARGGTQDAATTSDTGHSDAGPLRDAAVISDGSRPANEADSGPDAGSNPSECPAQMPAVQALCWANGVICHYASLSGSIACGAMSRAWRYLPPEGAAPCPKQVPVEGSPCPNGQQCGYAAASESCSHERRTEAECSARGSWDVWQPAGCASANPTRCDPRGHWTVSFVYDDDSDSGTSVSCGSPMHATTLAVRSNAYGDLQLQNVTGEISADGCKLHILWITSWTGLESGSNTYDIEMQISGATAAGTVKHVASGFCPNKNSGTASAVHTSN